MRNDLHFSYSSTLIALDVGSLNSYRDNNYIAKMNTRLLTSVFIVCFVLSVVSLIYSYPNHVDDVSAKPTRESFQLPKIFDFEYFKQLFKKRYNSMIENLARKRTYLCVAFKVFASAVKYKYRLSSSYLAINPMSDWTSEEMNRALLPAKVLTDLRQSSNSSTKPNVEQDIEEELAETKVVDLDTIEQKLEEIKMNNHLPGYKEILQELNESRRKKRGLELRELELDELIKRPESDSVDKVGARIPTNNPNYQIPELMSFGSEDNLVKESLDEDEAKVISEKPSGDFLSSTISTVSDLFTNYANSFRYNPDSLPDIVYIDQRKSGCFFPPRSQGTCGSCYAFAAIALYEWSYCMATGVQVAFSEQYIIDCGARVGLQGCQGGEPVQISEFVKHYGLETRSNYPYRMIDEQCPYDDDTPPHSMGFLRVEDRGFSLVDLDLVEAFLRISPMVMNIRCNENFLYYGGGVDKMDGCRADKLHAIVLIGSGREDGEEYWLFRNSHSEAWGEKGYYKMTKNNNCINSKRGAMLRVEFDTYITKDVNPNYNDAPIKQRFAHQINSVVF